MATKISVCMATYNGESYIEDQIFSIIRQLSEKDELIIVDDCSKDNTLKKIEDIKKNDNRIKIFKNKKNKGHVKTFESAIKYSTGDIIFLSDQDDIWHEDKVKKTVNSFKKEVILIATAFEIFYNNSPSHKKYFLPTSNRLFNIARVFIGKTPYYGCTMAFKKELKKIIIPFPEKTEAHDVWIALSANIHKGEVLHLNDVILMHRLHDKNQTPRSRRAIWLVLKTRVLMLKGLIHALLRVMTYKC